MTSNDSAINPWANMPPETQRRVEGETIHDLFWIMDASGRVGLYVSTDEFFSERSWRLSLRGIDVIRAPSSSGGGRYTLLLRENENWEIFALLCQDLVGVAQQRLSSRHLIGRMEMRLRKWQRLLAHDVSSVLSVEMQMGLFAELCFMADVLASRVGLNSAVLGWRGPERDKQDFCFDMATIEVKSYVTSKGPTIRISSANQLWSEKPNLYLAAYAISISENGKTIDDLYVSLRDSLMDDVAVLESLDLKLAEYGYVRRIHADHLIQFANDRLNIYRVLDGFPRINPATVSGEIVSLNYSIDLSRCDRFSVPLEEVTL